MIIKNYMFEAFDNIPAIKKIIDSTEITNELKFEVLKLIKIFTESNESKTFFKTIESIKIKHSIKDKNNNPIIHETEDGPKIDIDDINLYKKELTEFYNTDTELEIEKIKITKYDIEKIKLSARDLLSISWLFDFE